MGDFPQPVLGLPNNDLFILFIIDFVNYFLIMTTDLTVFPDGDTDEILFVLSAEI